MPKRNVSEQLHYKITQDFFVFQQLSDFSSYPPIMNLIHHFTKHWKELPDSELPDSELPDSIDLLERNLAKLLDKLNDFLSNQMPLTQDETSYQHYLRIRIEEEINTLKRDYPEKEEIIQNHPIIGTLNAQLDAMIDLSQASLTYRAFFEKSTTALKNEFFTTRRVLRPTQSTTTLGLGDASGAGSRQRMAQSTTALITQQLTLPKAIRFSLPSSETLTNIIEPVMAAEQRRPETSHGSTSMATLPAPSSPLGASVLPRKAPQRVTHASQDPDAPGPRNVQEGPKTVNEKTPLLPPAPKTGCCTLL